MRRQAADFVVIGDCATKADGMDWSEKALQLLVAEPACGYYAGQQPASEPTALAALALAAHGQPKPAGRAAEWLADLQAEDGGVGVRREANIPRWPTALAILAWIACDGRAGRFRASIDKAVDWALSHSGESLDPAGVHGHDVTLIGWPWVIGTYSWMEPTALQVAALKAAGQRNHPRTREAVQMLVDRQIASGGCNYGNNIVLGQTLRPHVLPTGMVLTALAGEFDSRGRIFRSLAYLRKAMSLKTTTCSMAWGLSGLAAHGRTPPDAARWLDAASRRLDKRQESPHQRALLLLASLGEHSPLITLAAEGKKHGK